MVHATFRTRPCEGETENGDRAVIRMEGGAVLVAVVDALGHGPVAARVADLAERCLLDVDVTEGLASTFASLHRALHGGRGAAVTAALVQGERLEACGVGNVALRVHGTPFSMAPTQGIVGVRARSWKSFRTELRPGSRLVLHSDGVSGRFDMEALAGLDADAAAALLFDRFARNHDDATLLVADGFAAAP